MGVTRTFGGPELLSSRWAHPTRRPTSNLPWPLRFEVCPCTPPARWLFSIRPIDIADMLVKLDAAATNGHVLRGGALSSSSGSNEHGSRLADLADCVRGRPAGSAAAVRRSPAVHRGMQNAGSSELYKATPVILVPAATGPAPRGLASTGDPRMNAPWTARGTPAVFHPDAGGVACCLSGCSSPQTTAMRH